MESLPPALLPAPTPCPAEEGPAAGADRPAPAPASSVKRRLAPAPGLRLRGRPSRWRIAAAASPASSSRLRALVSLSESEFLHLQLEALGINETSVATQADATAALATIDTAIDNVGEVLGDMGAAVNKMNYTYANIQVSIENFSASESVIRDVDMASEMVSFTKNQILLQAGTAMLAQANMSTQGVLSLMG